MTFVAKGLMHKFFILLILISDDIASSWNQAFLKFQGGIIELQDHAQFAFGLGIENTSTISYSLATRCSDPYMQNWQGRCLK